MTHDPATIYRYSYTSRRDGLRYTARVTLHDRIDSGEMVLLLIRPIGRWPDRADLTALADVAEEKGVPLVSGILLAPEDEVAWREANLRPEEGEWRASA